MYSREWPKRYQWVMEAATKHKALCRDYNKDIDITIMGESALRSHAKGEGHKKNEITMSESCLNFLVKKEPKSKDEPKSDTHSMVVPPPPPTAIASTSAVASSVSKFVARNDVLKAEIIWTMQTIMRHASYRSNENVNQIF